MKRPSSVSWKCLDGQCFKPLQYKAGQLHALCLHIHVVEFVPLPAAQETTFVAASRAVQIGSSSSELAAHRVLKPTTDRGQTREDHL